MTKIVIDTDEVLEVDEAAKEIGISRASCFNYLKAGKMVGLKINGRLYITRGEIERVKRSFEKSPANGRKTLTKTV